MKQFTFYQATKFVEHAMAKGDVRKYLNGAKVEFNDNNVVVVASDGHRLTLIKLDTPVPKSIQGEHFILSSEDVKWINTRIKCKADSELELHFSIDQASNTLTITNQDNLDLRVHPNQDLTYIDYQRVFNRDRKTELKDSIGFNSVYFKEAMTASATLTKKPRGSNYHGVELKFGVDSADSVYIDSTKGAMAALQDTGDKVVEAVEVIMPMRI